MKKIVLVIIILLSSFIYMNDVRAKAFDINNFNSYIEDGMICHFVVTIWNMMIKLIVF